MVIHLGKQISKYIKIDKLLKRSNSPYIAGVVLVVAVRGATMEELEPSAVVIVLTGTPIAVAANGKIAQALRF